ncbi:kinase-like domain-containing protein [Roridomyces roridus]|uniref:Kinase-like domain-containing protein n=1 Tax=Roridomyces roridus TaxID=1738132 RepID=A0AAD7CKS9_9AGAR|nr:kinase-like domain-containing protein [Roridomyces roridus]
MSYRDPQLLDYHADSAPTNRRRLFKALQRLSANSQSYPTCFSLNDLARERLVAGGSFSDVYSGYLRGQSVAVKMMRVFDGTDVDEVLKEFGKEAIIWRQLCHPNVLPFYGLYTFLGRLCLVSPWMENGHIRGYLKRETYDTDQLLSFVLDIALGLEYLHAEGIIHGDLKGDNIFVTPSRKACIADFGLSSIITSMSSVRFTRSSKAERGGTARYQAPELHDGGVNSHCSDIYGFACAVYELLTGTAPFPEIKIDTAVAMAVLRGERPARPPSCCGTPALDGLWSLIEDCWQQAPESRPTASQVVERLQGGDIAATETNPNTRDWDEEFTSRFRRQLHPFFVPSVAEFDRVISTTGQFIRVYCQVLATYQLWP